MNVMGFVCVCVPFALWQFPLTEGKHQQSCTNSLFISEAWHDAPSLDLMSPKALKIDEVQPHKDGCGPYRLGCLTKANLEANKTKQNTNWAVAAARGKGDGHSGLWLL